MAAHIVIGKKGRSKQPWHWHKISGRKIVSSAENFPSKGNALRAAKGEVRATIDAFPGNEIHFTTEEQGPFTILRWGGMVP